MLHVDLAAALRADLLPETVALPLLRERNRSEALYVVVPLVMTWKRERELKSDRTHGGHGGHGCRGIQGAPPPFIVNNSPQSHLGVTCAPPVSRNRLGMLE